MSYAINYRLTVYHWLIKYTDNMCIFFWLKYKWLNNKKTRFSSPKILKWYSVSVSANITTNCGINGSYDSSLWHVMQIINCNNIPCHTSAVSCQNNSIAVHSHPSMVRLLGDSLWPSHTGLEYDVACRCGDMLNIMHPAWLEKVIRLQTAVILHFFFRKRTCTSKHLTFQRHVHMLHAAA